jgi:hypothetical protein
MGKVKTVTDSQCDIIIIPQTKFFTFEEPQDSQKQSQWLFENKVRG